MVWEPRSSERLDLLSGRHGRQPDGFSIADTGEGLKAHVAPRDCPFIVGLEHERADEANDRFVIREDTHAVGAALDLPVSALEGVGAGASRDQCSLGKSM